MSDQYGNNQSKISLQENPPPPQDSQSIPTVQLVTGYVKDSQNPVGMIIRNEDNS